MNSLRLICENWSKFSFNDQLNEISNYQDITLIEITRESFKRLGILNKKVDGYASVGLLKTDEGATGIKISYSDTFHKIYCDSFNPTKFLFEIVCEFQRRKYDSKKLDGFLARGLRTLTSLLREPDFAEKLKLKLKPLDEELITLLSPKQDSSDHTDVFLIIKGKEYRIWLFQFSDRGLPHDIDRLTERRGGLPFGIHVLCPLKTELAMKFDSLLSKKRSREKTIIDKEDMLVHTSTGAIKRREELGFRIQTLKDEIILIEKELESTNQIMSDEIEVVSGWYFYSNKYIDRVAQKLADYTDIEEYSKVKEMLERPRYYLQEIQIFNKE